MGITTLGLRDPQIGISKKTLEEGLRNSIRAARLCSNADFQWWREHYLGAAIERCTGKLVAAHEDHNKSNVYRGTIRGISQALRELDYMAAQRESLEERLNDRREEPAN